MSENGEDTDQPGTGNEQPFDLRDSEQDASGSMGVSSEREGQTGPGQHGVGGTRDVSPQERDPDEEVRPEQSSGGPETNPDGLPPKAGYPSHHHKSDEHPWKDA